MTPKIERDPINVGDRVADKRWKSKTRPGRGTVVAVFPDVARVRWDGSGLEGIRDLSMIERVTDG